MAFLATPSPRAKSCSFAPLQCSNQRPRRVIFHELNSLSKNAKYTLQISYLRAQRVKRVIPIVRAASAPVEESEEKSRIGRILLSDVVVKRKRNVYWGRTWNSLDIGTVGLVAAMHFLSLFAPFTFNWGAFWIAVGLYVITGLLGITLSFHRNLSHRSFKLPKWLEYFFAYCGVQALQVSLMPIPLWEFLPLKLKFDFCEARSENLDWLLLKIL